MQPNHYEIPPHPPIKFIVTEAQQIPYQIPGHHEKNPSISFRRNVNFIAYTILFITAIITLLTYAIILPTYISPHLDIKELGSLFAFIMLFGSCGIVLVFGTPLLYYHWTKFPLRYKHVVLFDILLCICWLCLTVVALGAAETTQDRRKCKDPGVHCTKNWAPSSPSHLGVYISKVCGRTLDGKPIAETAENEYETSLKNPTKCKATKHLQISIYCMYIWTVVVAICHMMDSIFGLGNWWRKNEPEEIFVPDKPGVATAWGK